MNKLLVVIMVAFTSSFAFAGTAYVLSKDSGMILMYNAADYAGDDGPESVISICDEDFEGCMDLNTVESKNGDQGNVERYKDLNSDCEITIEDVNPVSEGHVQLVKIVAGAKSCKIQFNGKLKSISGIFH